MVCVSVLVNGIGRCEARRLLLEYWPWNGSSAPQWAATWRSGSEYVEYYAPDGSITFREYYNLRRDPWQLTNILHDGTSSNDPPVGQLHRQLAADRACVGSSCP
jgi:hypothetical protein